MAYEFEIYLVYGTCFLGLGLIALLQPGINDDKPVLRHFPLLGAFGVLHGMREYIHAWEIATGADHPALIAFAPLLLMVSFVPLFEFGRRAIFQVDGSSPVAPRRDSKLFYALVISLSLAVIFLSGDRLAAAEASARFFLAFTGSILAGFALLQVFPGHRFANYTLALSFWAYAVFGGLIADPVAGFPGWIPNTQSFLDHLGFPVQVGRAACAAIAMVSLTLLLRGEAQSAAQRLRESAARNRELAHAFETRVAERTQELEESERRLNTALQIGKLGYYVWDLETDRCTYCTEEYAAIHGMTVEEYISQSSSLEEDLIFVHPDDRKKYAAAFPDFSQSTEPVTVEYRLIGRDGRTRHVRETELPLEFDSGVPTKVEGTLQDITELRRAEVEARQNAYLFRITIDQMPAAVSLKTPDGRYVIVNKRFQEWFNPAGASVSNKRMEDLVPEVHVAEVLEMEQQVKSTGAPLTLEMQIPLASGTRRNAFIHKFPVFEDTGELAFIGTIETDTTELRAAEDKLRRAQRLDAIGQMTGGVAHDFNNLLSVILGNLELLEDEITEEEHIGLIQASIRATERGANLTRSMLNFAGRAHLRPTRLDLSETVLDMENWMSRTIPSSIDVKTALEPGLWPVEADLAGTESAILNLVINARDAMPNGGVLTIEARNVEIDPSTLEDPAQALPSERYVLLAISDTGTGIRSEDIEKVFDPFFSTKGPGGNSGLGLSMVHGFMQQSGGEVRIYSEVGSGSTVKLFFAASSKVDVGSIPTTISGDARQVSAARILVTEDEQDVLDVLRRILTSKGYDVVTASSGDEAAESFFSQGPFDLLITDIVMPGKLQGPALAHSLRQAEPGLPVVFMSGYAGEASMHGIGLGQEDIRLMKPVGRKEILNAVSAALLPKLQA